MTVNHAARKMIDNPNIRRFIQNCIKWGDGWRFKRNNGQRQQQFSSGGAHQQQQQMPLELIYSSPSNQQSLSMPIMSDDNLIWRYFLMKNNGQDYDNANNIDDLLSSSSST